MSDIVTYEAHDRVALITLNRPEARNAVNGDVAQAMEAAIDRIEDDDDVWVGILQANTEGQDRPVFCAGADLKAINSGSRRFSDAPSAAASPGSSTASATSRSSSPSTAWPRQAAVRSCSPPIWWSPRPARPSGWPR